jgi:hypothetical protein
MHTRSLGPVPASAGAESGVGRGTLSRKISEVNGAGSSRWSSGRSGDSIDVNANDQFRNELQNRLKKP